ncbi:MAG: hypothetical protein P8X81_02580 [Woeseiaceae bacterium]
MFYSDFEFNLHDALLTAGVERRFGRSELFQAGDEQACFEALAPSAQTGWDLAVDYYSKIVSPHEFNDRQQFLPRLNLAGIGEPDDRESQFLDIAAGFRVAAALAYRNCRWEAQDAANRRWIADVSALLDKHEPTIAPRLASLYHEPWPEQPIEVDVVQTVSWAGANSFFARGHAGHLMISSASQGHEAIETVFHEASHGFMIDDDALQQALRDAAAQLEVEVPRGLWHVVLFVTTGETVRQALVAAGEPDYEPMIVEIYGRSSWGQYKDAMNAVWPSYLDGTLGAEEAMIALINETRQGASQ